MELPGGGGEWLAASASPSGAAVPGRHDEQGRGLLSGQRGLPLGHHWGLFMATDTGARQRRGRGRGSHLQCRFTSDTASWAFDIFAPSTLLLGVLARANQSVRMHPGESSWRRARPTLEKTTTSGGKESVRRPQNGIDRQCADCRLPGRRDHRLAMRMGSGVSGCWPCGDGGR